MTKRTPFLLTLLTVVVTLTAGCAPAPSDTPGPTATPAPPQPVEVRAGGFAAYVPLPVDVTPAAPPYIPDLNSIANADIVSWLDGAQKTTLEANGFVVLPWGYEQIYQIYQYADESGIPAFVTTDAVLHAFHILYDYSLRLAEIEHFIADLESLTAAMLETAEADYAATDTSVQEAARQNLAFFAVAARLLTPDADVPRPVRDVVEEELTLIEAHGGIDFSPIFGYREDYSQYVPRGHYTRNENFERYFQAMMWYGRMAFHLTNPDDPEAARRETRGALLIVRALHNAEADGEPALDVWERIYEPTAFFVGSADDLTVYDYAAVAQEVYGGLPDPATLVNEKLLDEFIAAAGRLRPPAIVGGYVTDQQEAEVVTMGFRFMGQRFIPDSYIFQQLVYDKVKGYLGDPGATPFTISPLGNRVFPRGLDVPAALGSARALAILTAEGDTDYDGYAEQLAEVKGEGYPYFMKSPAWVDKDLHTWLGSWTELRHDTILYAKQSYAVVETAIMPEPEPARGYVEPQPEIYARLAALTAQMQAGLGGRNLLNDEMAEKLARMESLLLTLKEISEKELRGDGLTEDEYAAIRAIGDALEGLTTFSEEIEGQITSQADERMALVADVHTDPNSNLVLEEGVGDALPIYVVVLVDGRQVVTLGGVFSYYEFKWPIDDRLTDESWQAMSSRPDRPAWTESFIVE